MKKLLLLTNIAFIGLICASCQNSQQPKTAIVIESKPIIKDTAIVIDTKKNINNTRVVGTVERKKDIIKKNVRAKSIIHKAPEQEIIDSIKNVKIKLKK